MALGVRHPKDFLSGLIFILAGAGFLFLAQDYRMGTAVRMGPGYFPTLLSSLLLVLGLAIALRALLRGNGERPTDFAWRGLIIILASCLLFGVLVRGTGMVVALPLLIILSALASVKFRVQTALIMAVVLTLFCIGVFLKALGLPIPLIGTWLGG